VTRLDGRSYRWPPRLHVDQISAVGIMTLSAWSSNPPTSVTSFSVQGGVSTGNYIGTGAEIYNRRIGPTGPPRPPGPSL